MQISHANVNSSFRGTGLLEYLREKDEKDIIVVGLQTDNYNEFMWKDRYAKCISINKVFNMLKR